MHNSPRASSNLAMLELVARKLGEINQELVYLGGCTTALFINDPLALDVRPTIDVDCIINVISLGEYNQLSARLNKKGFSHSRQDSIICRWRFDDIILDIMPVDGKILGFGNYWYKEALEFAMPHQLVDDLIIKSITAPYFLATKIEAFKHRGNDDFFGSHDLEDIITVVAGRTNIVDEVMLSSDELKAYLKRFFDELLKNEQFLSALPGYVNEGPVTMQRVQTVITRIKNIIEVGIR